MMDVGDPAVERVLDRDHTEIGAALANGGESVLERGGGNRFAMRERLARREMGIRPGLALKNDPAGLVHG
jgi:hypothetical protein